MVPLTELLHAAFAPPAQPLKVVYGLDDEICGLSAERIGDGGAVAIEEIITSATSAPHEIFKTEHPHVKLAAALCYKWFNGGLVGNLLAQPGKPGVKPMIAIESALRESRPCWQQIIYGIDPHYTLDENAPTFAALTDESKRRLWVNAYLSIPHARWEPWLQWSSPRGLVSRSVAVGMPTLRRVLALCEHCYHLGLPKHALLKGLTHAPFKLLNEIGIRRIFALDAILAPYRSTDEMLVAAFVVQRHPDGMQSPEEFQCLIP